MNYSIALANAKEFAKRRRQNVRIAKANKQNDYYILFEGQKPTKAYKVIETIIYTPERSSEEIRDIYGNIYKRYKGRVYITTGTVANVGNIAILTATGLQVVYYGAITEEEIEKQLKAGGLQYALNE